MGSSFRSRAALLAAVGALLLMGAAEAAKSYTFNGYSVEYPTSWKIHDDGKGGPAIIYFPADGGLAAKWQFNRRQDPGKRAAEAVRDSVAESMAKSMPKFELKEKGAYKLPDGHAAAYVLFAHSVVEPRAVERHSFIPHGDDFVLIVTETAVESEWEKHKAELARMTLSVKSPGRAPREAKKP